MNDPDLEPLAPDLAALLAAERPPVAVPPGVHARVLQHVEAATAAPAVPGAPPAAPHGTAAPSPPGWLRRLPFLATFVAGGAVGAALFATLRPAAPPRTVFVERTVEVRTMASPQPAMPAPPVDAEPSEGPPAPRTSRPSSPAPRPPTLVPTAAGDRDVGLSRERALLETARTAVARGDGPAALAGVERHARQFPRGALAEEREVLWIQALLVAGRRAEAGARAERFRREYPGSLAGRGLEAALRTNP